MDGFQGGEREVVLLSLVRSNVRHEVGFVRDERRLNVAVTRARRHCVVFGDSDTFSETPSVSSLMTYICEHGVGRCALELLELDSLPSAAMTNMTVNDLITVKEVETQAISKKVEVPKEAVSSSSSIQANDTSRSEEEEVLPKPPVVAIDLLAQCADLSPGSAYLAHRPKSVVIEVKVKYKNRVGTLR